MVLSTNGRNFLLSDVPCSSRDRTDLDVIRENHKFLWTEEDDPDESWWVGKWKISL